jgi:hypothetical protein
MMDEQKRWEVTRLTILAGGNEIKAMLCKSQKVEDASYLRLGMDRFMFI